MAVFVSDGKKLLNVEYDDIPDINDIVDDMRVLSKNENGNECAIFLLESNGNVCCYILDEIYILGKDGGFENLPLAIEAWKNNQI